MEAMPVPAGELDGTDTGHEDLALRARSDIDAFAQLYVLYREPVFRYLRALSSSEDDALELTAIAFERAFAARKRYETRGGGVLAWLLRIARNAAIDQARGRRRRSSHLLGAIVDATADSPERLMVADEERRQLLRLIALLPELQRDAIALRYGAGLTAREIGRVIGKGEEATQKLITRALARLREDLR